MSSIKSVFLSDHAGSNMLSYYNNNLKLDPSLITGMFSALDSFVSHITGGGIDELHSNGLTFLFDKFYIQRELVHDRLYKSGCLKLGDYLLPSELFPEVSEGYVLDKSVIKDPCKHDGVMVHELVDNLSINDQAIKVFDLDSGKELFIGYKPEYRFSVSVVEEPSSVLYYCMIVDSNDLSLGQPLSHSQVKVVCDYLSDYVDVELAGDVRSYFESQSSVSFVEQKFNELGGLLKANVQFLGQGVYWDKTDLIEERLKPLIKAFCDQYVIEQRPLIESEFLIQAPARFNESLIDVKKSNQMKQAIKQITHLLNNS